MSATVVLITLIVPLLSIPIWQDAAQPIKTRVEALLSQMTTQEKIYQLQDWNHYPPPTFNYGIGRVRALVGNPAATISYRNQQQSIIINGSRLNIPGTNLFSTCSAIVHHITNHI